MLGISGSNFRKSIADWTLVDLSTLDIYNYFILSFIFIRYSYKEEWIRVSTSDSLLASLYVRETAKQMGRSECPVLSPPQDSFHSDVHKHDVTLADSNRTNIYGFS